MDAQTTTLDTGGLASEPLPRTGSLRRPRPDLRGEEPELVDETQSTDDLLRTALVSLLGQQGKKKKRATGLPLTGKGRTMWILWP